MRLAPARQEPHKSRFIATRRKPRLSSPTFLHHTTMSWVTAISTASVSAGALMPTTAYSLSLAAPLDFLSASWEPATFGVAGARTAASHPPTETDPSGELTRHIEERQAFFDATIQAKAILAVDSARESSQVRPAGSPCRSPSEMPSRLRRSSETSSFS